PKAAVTAVGKYVGGGRIPPAIVEKALLASAQSFVADPDSVVSGSTVMRDLQEEVGTLKVKVDLSTLFEPGFYQVLALKPSN
ncbi:MAG: hypothetical protein ACKVH0_11305, partial [Alphaproteobacteria bacterium]